jgi:hypothetical protein
MDERAEHHQLSPNRNDFPLRSAMYKDFYTFRNPLKLIEIYGKMIMPI